MVGNTGLGNGLCVISGLVTCLPMHHTWGKSLPSQAFQSISEWAKEDEPGQRAQSPSYSTPYSCHYPAP